MEKSPKIASDFSAGYAGRGAIGGLPPPEAKRRYRGGLQTAKLFGARGLFNFRGSVKMAKKNKWRFWLFIAGVVLSLIVVAAEIALIALGLIGDLSWVVAAVLGVGAFAPAILLGLPYANSRFYIAYDKRGLVIREERRSDRAQSARPEGYREGRCPRDKTTDEYERYSEWA
jgi:hypothetical protein